MTLPVDTRIWSLALRHDIEAVEPEVQELRSHLWPWIAGTAWLTCRYVGLPASAHPGCEPCLWEARPRAERGGEEFAAGAPPMTDFTCRTNLNAGWVQRSETRQSSNRRADSGFRHRGGHALKSDDALHLGGLHPPMAGCETKESRIPLRCIQATLARHPSLPDYVSNHLYMTNAST
jgi:hypothetical protein